MDSLSLKKEMMKLWKKIFHDSDEYIELIFGQYFNPELVEYEELDGHLVSALMGLEYEFKDKATSLKGLYLCGLSTVEEHRGEGLMSLLLDRINAKARKMGYTFTFLIPAGEGIRKYYKDRDYVDGFYLVANNYTNVHDFTREYKSTLTGKDERISSLKMNYYNSLIASEAQMEDPEEIRKIVSFIGDCENADKGMRLMHKPQDIIAILMDNKLSNGDVVVVKNKKGELRAVSVLVKTGGKIVKVLRVYQKDQCGFFRALDWVKRKYYDYGMVVYQSTESDKSVALWQENVASGNDTSELLQIDTSFSRSKNAESYGMVRILNFDEILKFVAEDRSDSEFSILVKNTEFGTISSYTGKNGKFSTECFTEDEFIKKYGEKKLGEAMSPRGLASILCRKPDTDSWIIAAFGLPRLGLSMCLMLD